MKGSRLIIRTGCIVLLLLICTGMVQSRTLDLNLSLYSNGTYTIFESFQPDVIIEEGLGVDLRWDYDKTPATKPSFVNSTLYQNGTFIDNDARVNVGAYQYTVDPGLLNPGIHNFTLVVYYSYSNGSEYQEIDLAIVTVLPQASPVLLNGPENNVNVFEGFTQFTLNWTFFDLSSNTYNIFRNGSQVVTNQAWISSVPIIFEDTSVIVGEVYNYTIVVTDLVGLEVSDTTLIKIIANPVPNFSTSPDDYEINKTSVNNFLIWEIDDNDPRNYTLYQDGIVVLQDLVPINKTIKINIDGLNYGTYNYTIVVEDSFDQESADTVEISVVDGDSPIIISIPSSTSYHFGDSLEILSWVTVDDTPNQYMIYQNGTQVANGIWSNNLSVSFIPAISQVGDFNFTIIFSDEFQNTARNTVFIEIIPISTSIPDISISRNPYVNSIDIIDGSWVLNPEATITAKLYQNGNLIKTNFGTTDLSGSIKLNLTYSNVDPGNYTWNILFEKLGYATKVVTESVEVNKSLVKFNAIYDTEFVRGQTFTIQIELLYVEIENISTQGTLSLVSLIYDNSRIIGEDISLLISYTNMSGGTELITKNAITNNAGIATFVFEPQVTLNIKKIIGISIQMNPDQFDIQDQNLDKIPNVIASESSNGLVDQNILFVIIGVLIVLPLMIGLITFLTRRSSVERFSKLEQFEHLVSIHMVVLSNVGGIPMYEQVYSKMNADSALIAGLSNAISSFMDEFLIRSEKGLEVLERDKLSIVSHRSEISNLTIVTSPKLPTQYHSNIEDIHGAIEEMIGTAEITKDIKRRPNYEQEIFKSFNMHSVRLNLLSPFSFSVQMLIEFINDAEVEVPRILRDNIKLLTRAIPGSTTINEFMDHLAQIGFKEKVEIVEILFALDDLNLLLN